jgi:hypothetical protein
MVNKSFLPGDSQPVRSDQVLAPAPIGQDTPVPPIPQ